MHAPVLYMVKVWVSPDGGERYLRWLEEKHMAEVIREPGFLWAQRCRLEQRGYQRRSRKWLCWPEQRRFGGHGRRGRHARC